MSNASFTYAMVIAVILHVLAGVILSLPGREETLNKAPSYLNIKLGQQNAPSMPLPSAPPSYSADNNARPKRKIAEPMPTEEIAQLAQLEPAAGKEELKKKDTPKPKKAAKKKAPPPQATNKTAAQETPRRPKKNVEMASLPSSPPIQAVKGSILGDTTDNNAQDTLEYKTLITQWFKQHKKYPPAAERNNQEGVGTIDVEIDRQGNVLKASISSSTGHPLLDRELLKMANKANPFPAMPPHIYPEDKTVIFGLTSDFLFE